MMTKYKIFLLIIFISYTFSDLKVSHNACMPQFIEKGSREGVIPIRFTFKNTEQRVCRITQIKLKFINEFPLDVDENIIKTKNLGEMLAKLTLFSEINYYTSTNFSHYVYTKIEENIYKTELILDLIPIVLESNEEKGISIRLKIKDDTIVFSSEISLEGPSSVIYQDTAIQIVADKGDIFPMKSGKGILKYGAKSGIEVAYSNVYIEKNVIKEMVREKIVKGEKNALSAIFTFKNIDDKMTCVKLNELSFILKDENNNKILEPKTVIEKIQIEGDGFSAENINIIGDKIKISFEPIILYGNFSEIWLKVKLDIKSAVNIKGFYLSLESPQDVKVYDAYFLYSVPVIAKGNFPVEPKDNTGKIVTIELLEPQQTTVEVTFEDILPLNTYYDQKNVNCIKLTFENKNFSLVQTTIKKLTFITTNERDLQIINSQYLQRITIMEPGTSISYHSINVDTGEIFFILTLKPGEKKILNVFIDIISIPQIFDFSVNLKEIIAEDTTERVPEIIKIGSFKTKISHIQNKDIAKSFHNYPNPFNPEKNEVTNISYYLNKNTNVSISIYTCFGELVREILKNEFQTENLYDNIIWDGKDQKGRIVSSGIYLCILKIEKQKFVKKIAVMCNEMNK